MKWQNHIVTDKEVLLGKPIIKGTRISVQLILELLANGWTIQTILESYPNITIEDLKEVNQYIKEIK